MGCYCSVKQECVVFVQENCKTLPYSPHVILILLYKVDRLQLEDAYHLMKHFQNSGGVEVLFYFRIIITKFFKSILFFYY